MNEMNIDEIFKQLLLGTVIWATATILLFLLLSWISGVPLIADADECATSNETQIKGIAYSVDCITYACKHAPETVAPYMCEGRI